MARLLYAALFDSAGLSEFNGLYECGAAFFYQWGLNGTIAGVVLVHSVHGLIYSIWISVAAFSSLDPLLARASRNLGAGPLYTFFHITLPQAAPGLIAASIFVFLESLDEFTATFFLSARRISPPCRSCSIPPACPGIIRSRRLPR